MRIKKVASVLVAAALCAAMLGGCGTEKGSAEAETGSVNYLNFKPEVATVWEDIAKAYTEETGVEVKVTTAASGTYEQTLKSEMAKSDAPTLFQINGSIGYQNWAEYCADWSNTDIYSWLTNKNLAVTGTDGTGVYGLPYVVEGFGIIYNQSIMNQYFALADKAVSIGTTEEIKDFATLKAVAEDMQLHKDELGIEGAFASTSLTAGEDWRWQTHTLNVPIAWEYKKDGVTDKQEIDFTYSDNYKNIFDLYINNSCTEPAMLGSKSVDDSMSEFALGKVAMVQNGNWAWNQINGVDGNVVAEEDVKFLPIYTGVEGEEKQGLCIGTEGFLSLNSQASEADQKASVAFLEWLYSSDTGKDFVTNKLGFITPFNTFTEEESPTDPLAQEVLRYMNDENYDNFTWVYTTFPSQTFKDDLGANLMQYAQGSMEWDTLVTQTVEEWKTEKAALVE
ncbi:MAG: ABC transporter substrate-binding protein [Lachnospiraceae bacterium]|nr:ABC transporter substrate-binding protein [Lachnospiraceae bacterium]